MRWLHPSPADCKFRDLEFTNVEADQFHTHADIDVWVLALPNNLAAPFVKAIDAMKSTATVVDLSADYRFDPTWTYGLPERKGARAKIAKATKIVNPGCYATGMQTTLFPILDTIQPGYHPHVFGVSGYSGAGTTPF